MSTTIALRRIAHLTYGDALASGVRKDGEFPVIGSGGCSGFHAVANTSGPAIIIGRKGSFGAIHWEGRDCFVIDTAYSVSPHDSSTDMRWLFYALQAVDLKGASQDVGVPGLSRDVAYSVQIPVCTIDEQRRIADFLDTETARIHSLVKRRQDQLELLDERALGAIDDTIAQVPDPVTVRLGYLAQVQTGLTVDGNRQHDGDVVTLPYLRVANVQVGRVDLDEIAEITVPRRTAEASRLRPGDVLMTEGDDLDKLGRGTVWRGEIEDCLHQNHVFAVRPDTSILNPEYLALLTRASMARDYFERTGNKTTNLASTSSSKIRDFRIPLIDTGMQRALVKDVDARLQSISEFEERLCRQLALLAERRQALITAAVTGQINVTTAGGVSA